MDSKKRTLVTGGAGFLGSHLCEYLLNDGHEVICVDDFNFSIERLFFLYDRLMKYNVIANDLQKKHFEPVMKKSVVKFLQIEKISGENYA